MFKRLAVLLSFVLAGLAHAGPITYDVARDVAGATVTGTITTDGTMGAIRSSNILSWLLTLDSADGLGHAILAGGWLPNPNSTVSTSFEPIIATATELLVVNPSTFFSFRLMSAPTFWLSAFREETIDVVDRSGVLHHATETPTTYPFAIASVAAATVPEPGIVELLVIASICGLSLRFFRTTPRRAIARPDTTTRA